jgi:hypothetical protein
MIYLGDWMRYRVTPLELQQFGRAIAKVLAEELGTSDCHVSYYYAGYPYLDVR